MNVNQKIETALSDVVNENIWPLSCPLETTPDEYIVYSSEDECAEYGDNKAIRWRHYMEVNWYKKDKMKRPVNYIEKRKEIRFILEEAGFKVSGIVPLFEKDTGYTHLVFLCNIQEENPYGEM